MSNLSRSARWALAALALSMLMPSLDTSIANAGLPALAAAFAAPYGELQWVVLAYLFTLTTLIVGAGRLGDIIGRKRLLLAGIAIFTLASLLCGAAPTIAMLVAARAAQGLGAAIMLAMTIALVGETVPSTNAGSAMGLLGSMSAIGTTLGPSIGGVLIAGVGWRTIFLVNVPLGILNVILAARYLPRDSQGSKPIGKRVHSPLVQVTPLCDPTLLTALAMSALVATVLMATLVVGPFYLTRSFGLSAASVGFVLSAGPLVAALTGVPAGRMVDRFGAQRMTIVGLLVITGGCGALAAMPATLGLAGYLAPIAITTAGYAMFQTANNTAVMSGAHAQDRGVLSGLLNLARNLGLISGTSLMGALFVATGLRTTFAFAVALMLGAITIAVFRTVQNSRLTTTMPDSASPPEAA